MDPGIVLEGVTKRYPDGTHALCRIDLTVERGELVTVVGPSGCGKSTLLRIASGLIDPSSGAVSLTPGGLGYVFQDPTLLPWRTVRRNVELLGELHGIPASERRVAADEALATVGLAGAADRYPRTLSGGMQMRASLARALTMRPNVFLFDEPFGALDEMTRERLNDELLRLFSAARFAGLFVTHSVAEAVFLGTRVLVMSEAPGSIVLDRPIPFELPRERRLRYDASFARVCGDVSQALRS
ncbi:MAG: ABC transporter ATP-binding protein [Acidimicrobiales bacterium]